MQVREYLAKKNIQIRKERGDEIIMNCPFCSDTEFKGSINSTTGAYNCLHLNRCDARYSWFQFQKALGDEPKRLLNDNLFYRPKKTTYQQPQTKPQKPDTEVIQYLKNRNFSDKTIKYFKIGQQNNNTVMLPYFKNNKLTNIKYRSIKEKKMWSEKNAEPTLFNRDNITKNELIITEGCYDCMALHEYGIESVSVPNGANDFRWVETEWEWLEKFTTIYLCFDSDAAGQKGLQEAAQRLGLWRCQAVTFPKKDANECLKAGILKNEIYDCLLDAQNFNPAILTRPSDFTDEVIDLFLHPDKLNGISTGWKKLDQLLGGWRESELTVWSGRNSAGKSTILNQVFLNLAQSGVKSCIASLEMRVPKYLRWAVMQYTGETSLSKKEIEKALEWMTEKLFLLNTLDALTPTAILDIFEYAARKYGVKHFLIDSLMKLSFPEKDELNEHKKFINQLTTFADKFKCHVHLVAHPRKGARDSERPGKVDIMGTGHITNLAHNVLIMHRPGEEEIEAWGKEAERKREQTTIPDAILYVKKNREKGTEGGIKLRFSPRTKKFDEVEEATYGGSRTY